MAAPNDNPSGLSLPVHRLPLCVYCGLANLLSGPYCGPKCEVAARRGPRPQPKTVSVRPRRTRRPRPPRKENALASGVVGAIKELVVCADILARGHHAFRAVSPACPCDVIAMIGRQLLRIEVRTGYRKADGSAGFNAGNPALYDVLACVFPDHKILYVPDPFQGQDGNGKY